MNRLRRGEVKVNIQGHRLVNEIIGMRILIARLFCDALLKVLRSPKQDINVNFKESVKEIKAKAESESLFSFLYLSLSLFLFCISF